jgi:hypothetical protein
VTLELPSGARSRPDLLTELPEGGLKVREAKMGETAKLTGGQKELKQVIEEGKTVIPVGQNAVDMGLTPKKPITIKVFEEDRY